MNIGNQAVLLVAILLAACGESDPRVLGTLERDRIVLPSPSFERIVEIHVREGERVSRGTLLLSLEPERAQARSDALSADVHRLADALAEAREGPRKENIAAADAQRRKSQSLLLEANQDLDRVSALVERKLLPMAERDRARARRDAAQADLASAEASLGLLKNGTREEQVAQAESALASAQAQLASAQIDLGRVEVRAPRDGVVEQLPYHQGDQPTVGAPLAILLVGERPFARVYLPQPVRQAWQVGALAAVQIHGDSASFPARVRMIRSEPVFTPYFSLSGKDAARLSYLAELEFEQAADSLPLGAPVSAQLQASASASQ